MTILQFSHGEPTHLRSSNAIMLRQIWPVGALCLAISDSLQARFNPVTVRGELSSYTRAASGHCYFTLKDENGQLRVAMFKRAAIGVNFNPEDGQQVEVTGQLGVYERRGELQLVADTMTRVGQGTLLEAFMRLKSKLQAEGLFDSARKRPLAQYPRGIGVVTSSGAAAWHDVMSTLHRRVPHIPVVLAPALVQGVDAHLELVRSLQSLYRLIDEDLAAIDTILLVRGGGSIEDLWAFNDERLAYTIAQSPVPIISGVGHETDFSIADFVADVRAPTPTAAAELCATPALQALSQLALLAKDLHSASQRYLERRAQHQDILSRRLRPPSDLLRMQHNQLQSAAKLMQHALQARLQREHSHLVQRQSTLTLLHPQHVLNRGFAWVSDQEGEVVTGADQVKPQQKLNIHFSKGERQAIVQ